MSENVPLSVAAQRLGLDYQQCRRLVLTGALRGGRDEYGRMGVDAADVERYQREHPAPTATKPRPTRRAKSDVAP